MVADLSDAGNGDNKGTPEKQKDSNTGTVPFQEATSASLKSRPAGRKISVLIVDDSLLMRKIITDTLLEAEDITVVGTAKNGLEALKKIEELNPDVVTLDIEMPKMDGLEALEQIMKKNPKPVIILSAYDRKQADITLTALSMGAFDFIPKPSGTLSLDLSKQADLLISKIRAAAKIPPEKIKELAKSHFTDESQNTEKVGPWWSSYGRSAIPAIPCQKGLTKSAGTPAKRVILIGASTGGPKAIEYIITRLPATLPAGVIIVQHMPEGFTKSFAERLNTLSQLEVKEAEEGDEIQTGRVIIAPGNRHLRIIGGRIILSDGEKINNVRPAADPMMESGANEYGSNTMGIILTGMGVDGARGMAAIKKHGGKTIAQDRESSVVFGMPRAAIELGAVDVVVPLVDIPRTILRTLETMI